MLACTTADTPFGVNHRYFQRLFVLAVYWHHLYGTRRTVSGTIATANPIGQGYAVFLHPNGMTYSCRRLLFNRYGLYGICRTHIGTIRKAAPKAEAEKVADAKEEVKEEEA